MGLLRMRMDALHYALLAVLVLLVFYAASTYGLFKEHVWTEHPSSGLPAHHANPQLKHHHRHWHHQPSLPYTAPD